MANILLIDDDIQVRAFARAVLDEVGHAVREANNGDEGLREYRRERPDVIVCDLFMPEREGLETIIELRRVDSSARVVAITGGTRNVAPRQLLATAKALGASVVLAKPFTADQLRTAVAEALATP